MYQFHIVYKEKEEDLHSKGSTLESQDIKLALEQFSESNVSAIIILAYRLNEFGKPG